MPSLATHHPDRLAGAHVIIVRVPALELGVLAALKDVLLALEVGVVEADPGTALHTDGVDAVHEATVLEVITVAEHLQLPSSEAFALEEAYLPEREVGDGHRNTHTHTSQY